MSGRLLEEIMERQASTAKTSSVPKIPKKYRVILLNDDYTPMDFVIIVLQRFFQYSEEKAIQIMLQIHIYGKAVGGIYSRDIAETKVAQVIDFARNNEHPLFCTVEPD